MEVWPVYKTGMRTWINSLIHLEFFIVFGQMELTMAKFSLQGS